MKDPKRNIPANNHWTFLDTRLELRPYCCSTASFVEINEEGQTTSHKWFMISRTGCVWRSDRHRRSHGVHGPQPAVAEGRVYASAARDDEGRAAARRKVLIGQGVNRTVTCPAGDTQCFDEKEGHFFQMFDPSEVDRGTRDLGEATGPDDRSRGLHGTATLMPDGTAFFAGENREALVRPDDPRFP